MFKKVVIADRLALVTDPIFAHANIHNASTLAIAALFYSIQIYCDFSGYSDIALGTARTMGFRLMVNFRSPYFSKSIAEFWQRWHISLSTWFRDYVYIPMGGNRMGDARTCINLLTNFLLSGLWHGADWKFVIWGAIHGFFLILGRIGSVAMFGFSYLPGWVRIGLTFLAVTLAWIFFRAHSMGDALLIIRKLATPALWNLPIVPVSGVEMMFCIMLIMLLFLKERCLPDYVPARWSFWPSLWAWLLSYVICGAYLGATNLFISNSEP